MARAAQTYPPEHELAGDDFMLETGRGIVQTFVEPPVGTRNVRVEFKATHVNLTKPVAGYLDMTNDAHVNLVRWSVANGAEIAYRIEVHRKRNVDRNIVFEDLSSDQKVRDLVWVGPARPASDGGAPAQAPAQAPAAQPAPQAASRPPAEPQRAQQAPQPQGDASSDEDPAEKALLTERPKPQQRPAQTRPAGVGRVQEGKPWETQNSDGSPNLGAYAVTAAVGIIDLAAELLLDQDVRPNGPTIEFVSTRLMEACDEIQASVRLDGKADRMDNSHTRARAILHTTLRWLPFPTASIDGHGKLVDDGADQVHAWHAATVKAGSALLRQGLVLSGIDWRSNETENRAGEQAERERRAAIIAEWSDPDEFNAAHGTYTKLMQELDEPVREKVKAYKTERGIGWPLLPEQYQDLVGRIQAAIKEAAEPACEFCHEKPCVCDEASPGQDTRNGQAPVCSSCGRVGPPFCEACEPF